MSLRVIDPINEPLKEEPRTVLIQVDLPADLNAWVAQVRDGFDLANKPAAIVQLLRDYYDAVGGQPRRFVRD